MTAWPPRITLSNFNQLFEASPAPIAIARLDDGVFVQANDAFLRLYGYSLEEIIGHTSTELGLWSKQEERDKIIELIERQGHAHNFIHEYRNKAGKVGRSMVSLDLIEIDGTPHMLGVLTDLAELDQAQAALVTSEERLRFAQRASGIGVWEWLPDTDAVYWTTETEAMFGLPPGGFGGNYDSFLALVHPTDRDLITQQRQALLATDGVFELEYRIVRPDGSIRWVLTKGAPERDESGALLRVAGLNIDMTERKQSELRLQQSHARIQAIIDASPVPLALNDEQGNVNYLNPAFTKAFGYDCHDIKTVEEWWPQAYPDTQYRQWVMDSWRSRMALAKHTRLPFSPLEVRVACKHGGEKVVLATATTLDNAYDNEYLVVLYDITERKRLEAEREENTRRLHAAVRGGRVALWEWDLRTDEVLYSEEWKAHLGYEEGEISNSFAEWQSRVHPEDLGPTLQKVDAYLKRHESAYTAEFRMRHKDGSYRWIFSQATLVADEQDNPIRLLGSHVDITETKGIQSRLYESEERLRLLIEHAPVALAMFDREMRYLAVSRGWLNDFELGDRDIIGVCHYEIFPDIPERWKDIHRRVLAGEVVSSDDDYYERGQAITYRLRWEVRPWYAADGSVGGIVIFSEDITTRKRMEEALQQANTELEHRVAERTRELRQLAAETTLLEEKERQLIAHDLHDDLGQLLYAAKVKLGLLAKSAADGPAAQLAGELDALLADASTRVRTLTAQLNPPVLERLGLIPALEWLAEQMEQVYGLTVEVEDDGLPKPLSPVQAAILFRAVRELVINVFKHAQSPIASSRPA
ncbi:PAS domain S-box protein [Methylogaea oryzae]|uniref:sensor histidine kinase n=1 Tax=Methylogaea oryzae TaxID=1295382 RepID=UPI0006D139DB|nr:PAS domain S-box protein [Methylogaea oryzae]